MTTLNKIIEAHTPKTVLPVNELFKKRFSPRVFKNDPIPEEDIKIILEAARLAPSGRNHQPWYFKVFNKGNEEYAKLVESIEERNLIWAKTAPTLILCCYDKTEPTDDINKWAEYDLGQAVISMILQGEDLGYKARQIGSFKCDKVSLDFSLDKEKQIPLVLVAMGKMGGEKEYSEADPLIIEKELIPWTRKDSII